MKILTTLICLFIHFSTEASSVKQKEFNFRVSGQELLKGDVYYSAEVISRKQLKQLLPELLELDTTGFTATKKSKLLVSKAAYVVQKPIGFFDHKKADDLTFIRHFMGEQKVLPLGERTYRVEIPGGKTQSYKMRLHFDSDDISTTTNSRAIRAITGAKKLDLQVQGASSILVRESWDYNRGAFGAIHVTAFIILKEDRTLVIDYGVMALRPPFVARETMEESISDEAEAHQLLINSFKAD